MPRSASVHGTIHGDDILCGLPSNGSRLQSVTRGLNPASPDAALKSKILSEVTCKRCRRAMARMRRNA